MLDPLVRVVLDKTIGEQKQLTVDALEREPFKRTIGKRSIEITNTRDADLVIHAAHVNSNGYSRFVSGMHRPSNTQFYAFVAERKDGTFEVVASHVTRPESR